MASPLPLYLMAKPPAETAVEIGHRRRRLGLSSGYAIERLHTTLLPLGDYRSLPRAALETICRAAASLHADPFAVAFDRLRGNALVGGATLGELHGFQKRLVRRLGAFGVAVPDYAFRPHLSLVYGERNARNIAIPPIGWTVEEFLLVLSIHGEGRHEVLARWPLAARQGEFGF